MAFVVQTIVKKNPGTNWWSTSNSQAAERLNTFGKSLNLVLRRRVRTIDENTYGERLFFASEAAHAQYQSAMESNPDWQARAAYGVQIGEVRTQQIFTI